MFKVLNTNIFSDRIEFVPDYLFERADFNSFTEKEWNQLLTLDETIEYEIDPLRQFSFYSAKMRFLTDPPYVYIEYYIVKSRLMNSEIIAYAMFNVQTPESSNYQHTGNQVRTWIVVHPNHRKKGIGTNLIKILCERGLELDKTEITFNSAILAGQKFLDRFTNKSALDSAENVLDLKSIDWDSIKRWNTEAKAKSPDITIETFEYLPDEIIERYAKTETALLNDVPFGDLGLKFTITPDQIRKWEEYSKNFDLVPIVKISREKDGNISGMTDIKFNPHTPTFIDQGLTGVLRKYRGRRLGLLLKTDMLLTIKKRFPEAKYIFTGNADENAPMLRINHQLGFKKHSSWKAYKFQINELLDKLNTN